MTEAAGEAEEKRRWWQCGRQAAKAEEKRRWWWKSGVGGSQAEVVAEGRGVVHDFGFAIRTYYQTVRNHIYISCVKG